MQRTALALAAALAAAPAGAAEGLVQYSMLRPETALRMAQAALESCRKAGFQVAVAVVDRMGVTQVLLRDRLAGPHTPETARRKAWTAVSFRTDTATLAEVTQAGKVQSAARDIPGALMLAGGLPVEAGGSIVGGIGVSGAPGGELDARCARDGIAAVEDEINF
ncbi:GlcG/HbpS family heme-binding protein [Inmirania thermothiophila]|uniref:Uncharacterized protein GlcG (DUF336 family) n=1 Tax=Inmirania thermothiophila TaxID=1750597 RepID=A0A3N1Y661_9GAMM|nr:heme-binding protein [Inmirania thermothiophila]ROR34275.1 uncharacterized protein GlcG (DUF336 family) [Inmirania thermothiophila]